MPPDMAAENIKSWTNHGYATMQNDSERTSPPSDKTSGILHVRQSIIVTGIPTAASSMTVGRNGGTGAGISIMLSQC